MAKVNEKFFFALGLGSGISFASSSGASSSEATCRLISEGKDAVSRAILFIKKSFWCLAVSFGSLFVFVLTLKDKKCQKGRW